MRPFIKRALSIALVLCTLATLALSFSLFAEENAEPEFLYRETFSADTVNTSGSNANITKANGTFVSVGSGSTFTLENKTLKYLTRASKDYVDIRMYLSSNPEGCTDDFVLSFWIKPDVDNLSMTGMTWYNKDYTDNKEDGIFKFNKGYYQINDTTYKSAQLVKDEWSLVEIVFHYDDEATAVNGGTGAFTYYTFKLNGEDVKDADGNVVVASANNYLHNVNYYRLFRYAGTSTYEMDDLTITRGTNSIINVPRTGLEEREFYFRETFSSGAINTSGSKAACIAANGLFVCHDNGSTYTLDNDTMKYLTRASKDYTDIRFYYDETAKDCTNDFILSFWIKPDVDNFKLTTMTWKQYSADVQENGVFKIVDGCYQINGVTYKNAHLDKDVWSLVEIVFHYDETAAAVTGETGATTYYTFMLNGETLKDADGNVVKADATYYFHNIDRYRMLQWAYGTYELDDLTIASGTQSLIDIPRTAPETPAGCEHAYDNDCDTDCNLCGEIREVAGHTYNAVVTAPTCTAQGYTTYTCACGDTYVGNYTEATGHNYNAVVTAPTCTEQGYTTYTCACGDSYVEDYTNATGHRYSGLVVNSATCTEDGWINIGCGNCGNTWDSRTDKEAQDYLKSPVGQFINVTAKGHKYEAVVTAPTCTEQGYTTYTCVCGDSYVEDYVDATGHRYSGLVVNSATCTEDGWINISCGNCGSTWDSRYDDEAKQYLADMPYINVTAKGHAYDNDFDADCNNCSETRPVPETEGELNTKITWTYADGVLTVAGKGKIKNFSAGKAPWAALNEYVETVVIGEGITYVGASAFYSMTNVTTVVLPDTLTAIGNYAFYGCSALNSVSIPENVTEIGAYAFRRTSVTTAIFVIGYGWSAGDNAFSYEDIVAGGANYLTVGFYKNTWTRDVNAPEETIDPNFVDGGVCGNNIKWTITKLENGKLKLTVSGEGAMPTFGTAKTPWFGYAADIVEIEVTEGVTTIGRCAFYGLKFVRKATIASTVTAIDDYGFYMCFLLKSIKLPEGVTVGTDAFKKTGVTI